MKRYRWIIAAGICLWTAAGIALWRVPHQPKPAVNCGLLTSYTPCAVGIGANAGTLLGDAIGCGLTDPMVIESFTSRTLQAIESVRLSKADALTAVEAIRTASLAGITHRERREPTETCADSLKRFYMLSGR